ncbi:MAG TPA: hypothetical protein VK205_09630 [Prolixibacteraceae bacterium]|nr:hypothetical protein [Prolixibacteraceae bacterium]
MGLSPYVLFFIWGSRPKPQVFLLLSFGGKRTEQIVKDWSGYLITHLRARRSQMKQRKEIGTVFSKVPPSFLGCSFLFAHPKRNEPKKKDAENENFNLFWQNALSITRPKKVEVHAISGLPSHDNEAENS